MKSQKDVQKLRAGAKQLERVVQQYARANSTTVDRVRLRIAALAICGALSTAAHAGIIPLYLIKGGLALELRFGYKARASKDLDVGIQAEVDLLPEILERALRTDFDAFSFRIKSPPTRTRSGAFRIEVQVLYKERSWSTVQLDLSEATYESGVETLTHLSLDDFGLHAPLVNVLSINDQIAEKIHALTAPMEDGRRGDRARDLIDILLCVDLLEINYTAMARACERVFADRLAKTPMHEWPPVFVLPPEWRAPLERLARENGLQTQSSDYLVSQFSLLIARLSGKNILMRQGFEYQMEEVTMGDAGLPKVNRLNDLAKDGWRIMETLTYQGNTKRVFFLFERELSPQDAAHERNRLVSNDHFVNGRAFLNVHLQMSTPGNGTEFLIGQIHNGGHAVASAIRGVITGVDEPLRIGTLTPRDAPVDLSVRIDQSDLRLRGDLIQFPTLILQFQGEDGVLYEQRGPLDKYGPDASGRHSYALRGLYLPQEIQAFTYRLDPGEPLA